MGGQVWCPSTPPSPSLCCES